MLNCNLLICIVCKKLTNKKGKNNIVENYILCKIKIFINLRKVGEWLEK